MKLSELPSYGRCCIVGDLQRAMKSVTRDAVQYCPEVYTHPSVQMQFQPDPREIVLTHSPLIVDKFEPNEVIMVKTDGTAMRLDQCEYFAKWNKMLTTGELWSLTWGDPL